GVLDGKKPGWVLDPEDTQWRRLTLLPAQPVPILSGSKLLVTIKQEAQHDHCPPALLRIGISDDKQISQYASLPESIVSILNRPSTRRDGQQQAELAEYFLANVEP